MLTSTSELRHSYGRFFYLHENDGQKRDSTTPKHGRVCIVFFQSLKLYFR